MPVSHTTRLLNQVQTLTDNDGLEFFRAPNGEEYVHAPRRQADNPDYIYFDTLPLNHDMAESYFSRAYWHQHAQAINATSLKDAIRVFKNMAQIGPVYPIYLRVAGLEDRVYIDLQDAPRSVVTVTADGWSVGRCPSDIRFVRKPGMRPLLAPSPAAERLETMIPKILNVSDEESLRLLIAWWLVALRGRPPYFLLAVRGESGSAKTTGSAVIRNLIDPNGVELSGAPRDERDLLISTRGVHVCAYDNMSNVSNDLSDALCRLATGSGMRTRKLTTDDTETLFEGARPILVNGIPDLLSRADLAARSLAIRLEHITGEQRRTEEDVKATARTAGPQIFGALLDALVAALKHAPMLHPHVLPRMADASRTVMAAEAALGWKPGSFVKLIEAREEENAQGLLEGDLVYKAVLQLPNPWHGALSDIRAKLPAVTEFGKQWTDRMISERLRRLEGPLRLEGITFKQSRTEKARLWAITRDVLEVPPEPEQLKTEF